MGIGRTENKPDIGCRCIDGACICQISTHHQPGTGSGGAGSQHHGTCHEADAELGVLIADETGVMPGRDLESRNLIKQLRSVLHVLDERERAILSLRFPLTDETPPTLEQIGKKFKVTRERIRQIQNVALKKLRTALETIPQGGEQPEGEDED